jgi:hypothetical protein
MASTEETRPPDPEVNPAAREQLDAAQEGRLAQPPSIESLHKPGPEFDARGPEKAVERASLSVQSARTMKDDQKLDAMEFLLGDGEDFDYEDFFEVLEINVGSDTSPKLIEWTIKPLDGETFQTLRNRAMGNRDARRSGSGELDVTSFNLMMVAAATVNPDLAAVVQAKGLQSADPLHGPMQVIANRFAHKPGLVDQIGGRVMLLSGYDEGDVKRSVPTMTQMRAAGN